MQQSKSAYAVGVKKVGHCLKHAALPAALITGAAIALAPGTLISIPPVAKDAQHQTLLSRIITPNKAINWKQQLIHGIVIFAVSTGILAATAYRKGACRGILPKWGRNAAGGKTPRSMMSSPYDESSYDSSDYGTDRAAVILSRTQ